jgi:hypothetical protein
LHVRLGPAVLERNDKVSFGGVFAERANNKAGIGSLGGCGVANRETLFRGCHCHSAYDLLDRKPS